MLRKISFIKRNANISASEFLRQWSETIARCARRDGLTYVRNDVLPTIDGFIPEPVWDGVVQVDLVDGLKREGSYLASLSDDGIEDELIDRAQIVQFIAAVQPILEGPEQGIKILSLPRRRAGLSPREFAQHYQFVHGELVKGNASFARRANRYVQHHVLSETVKVTGGFVAYDGISEFWFDDIAPARAAWTDPLYLAELRGDERRFVHQPPSDRVMVRPVIVTPTG
jgi:hypothetical protein